MNTATPLLDRLDPERAAVAHDPDYCDRHRPFGQVCNQPHAAGDPFGLRQPKPRWLDRAGKDLTEAVHA